MNWRRNWRKLLQAAPFHLIACHKNVTEGQAINLLGFPDATVVTPAFGVYVADPVQNIQLAFLANCRDESTTRFAVQRFNEWLYSSGEAEYLARRARKRKIIVEAIAGQLSPEQPAESGPRTPAKKQRAHR